MFGGAGIYRDGLMFALVANGQIYLKTDAAALPAFRQAGCLPFVFESKDRRVEMSYWSLPDEALDDSDSLRDWAYLAYAAALRARDSKPAKTPRIQAQDSSVTSESRGNRTGRRRKAGT